MWVRSVLLAMCAALLASTGDAPAPQEAPPVPPSLPLRGAHLRRRPPGDPAAGLVSADASGDAGATPRGAADAARGLAKAATSGVDWSLYRKIAEVEAAVEQWASAHPGVASLEAVTKTSADGQYTTRSQVVRVTPAGLASGDADKMRVFLVFGEHARELITVEVGLRVLELLGAPERVARELGLGDDDAARLSATLAHAAFTVLPMENVEGRRRVEGGKACERKNGRGVDINRNYEVDWGVKEPDYVPSEEYPGEAPLSEPEAALTLSLVRGFHPAAFINVHSGMFAMFAPYDHRLTVPDDDNARAQLEVLGRVRDAVCRECLVGAGGKTVGYLAHGTAADHMWVREGVPFVSTWEIYGDERAAFSECFRMFNPVTAAGRDAEVRRWTLAVARLLLELPSHPGVPAAVGRAIEATYRGGGGGRAGGGGTAAPGGGAAGGGGAPAGPGAAGGISATRLLAGGAAAGAAAAALVLVRGRGGRAGYRQLPVDRRDVELGAAAPGAEGGAGGKKRSLVTDGVGKGRGAGREGGTSVEDA